MKAAVLYETNVPVVIEDLDLEEQESGNVRIQRKASGVCHSDWHVIKGDWGDRIPIPVIMGHEGAGIVERLGPDVEGLRVDGRPMNQLVNLGSFATHTVDASTEDPVSCIKGLTVGGVCTSPSKPLASSPCHSCREFVVPDPVALPSGLDTRRSAPRHLSMLAT